MEPKLNIRLDQTVPVECPCGNRVFSEGVMLRKVSKILAMTSEDAMIPITVMVCTKCQTPLKEMLPNNLPND